MNDTETQANQYTELNQTLGHVESELELAKKRVKELSATRRRLLQAQATLKDLQK